MPDLCEVPGCQCYADRLVGGRKLCYEHALAPVATPQDKGDVTAWDTYFAPQDNIQEILIAELKRAANSGAECHSSQFGFTVMDVADIFVELAKPAGSRFLFDLSQSKGQAEAPVIAFLKTRISPTQMAVGTSSEAHQILHTKAVALLYPDGTGWTLTGSYNLSHTAGEQFNIVDVVRSRSRAELFANRIDAMFQWVKENENG